MAWRVARSLETLLAQLNAAHPKRSRLSDGAIGDAAHASRDSDHNPWIILVGIGIVTARDFTHDPANGLDCEALYQALVASRDPRIKYIIWNRTITSGAKQTLPWKRRPYNGTNAHTKHLHLSVETSAALFDDTRPWALIGAPVTIKPEDDMATVPQQEWNDVRDSIAAMRWIMDPVGGEAQGELLTRARDSAALLGAIAQRDPAAIASAIPQDLAQQVIEALGTKLKG